MNLYDYVGNTPVNKIDPLGMYEIDVHYYLTYYLATRTGCFTQPQANAIANATQGTDEDEGTSPGPNKRYANRTYHALNSNASEGVGSQHLWTMAVSPTPDFKNFGQYVHYLQDTFSHSGFTSPIWGHAAAGHYYDKTKSDPARAVRMAYATWNSLIDFAGKLGCECNPVWSPEIGDTVVSFSNAPGSNTPFQNSIDSTGGVQDFLRTNPPEFLERKRNILGIPRR